MFSRQFKSLQCVKAHPWTFWWWPPAMWNYRGDRPNSPPHFCSQLFSGMMIFMCLIAQVRTCERSLAGMMGQLLQELQERFQQQQHPCLLYLASEVIKVRLPRSRKHKKGMPPMSLFPTLGKGCCSSSFVAKASGFLCCRFSERTRPAQTI